AAVGWLSILVLALALPARAQNPRLSLRLEKVTAAEAADRLAAAAGVRVDLPAARQPGGGTAGLQERTDFDWRDATLARALRELCERCSLASYRSVTGYTLLPTSRPVSPPRPLPAVEKNGYRIFLRSVGVSENR